MKIIFVCTGNTCRSPMAEALFNNRVKDSGKFCASSCGLFADGSPISHNAKLVLEEVKIAEETFSEEQQALSGKIFVVTGSLVHFENRNVLKEKIEQLGGKVTGSVTGKTTALINNDITSNSSKNKKAKELGVEILTEEMFMEMYLKGEE